MLDGRFSMPKFITADQQSSAWLKAREGRITASRIKDVLSFNANGKPSAKRTGYLMELVAERLTGRAEEHYVSPAMDHGTEFEPIARAAYEMAFNVDVIRVGFAVHPALDFAGASVDGLVGDQGIIEIKAPNTTTHLRWIMDGVVPEEHVAQIQWGMQCTERLWGDFITFDPRMNDQSLQTFIAPRLEYDPNLPEKLQKVVGAKTYMEAVINFNAEIEETISKLQKGRAA